MFSITRAFALADLPRPLAICCHDAGAANLIAAWVASAGVDEIKVCAEGPAKSIFERECSLADFYSLPAALDGAATLLSGTGWASDLEHSSRVEAARMALPSLAVVDHWVNYRMRFVREQVEVLPDALIVTDEEAAKIARLEFGNSPPVLLWENRYLRNEAAKIQHRMVAEARHPPQRILVVLEPIRTDWIEGAARAPEFRALDYLLEELTRQSLNTTSLVLRLRPHPSEPRDKYATWCDDRRKDWQVELSATVSLAEDIAWADAVVGLHSYALVVAKAAGRKAFSYLPPEVENVVLQHAGIERLSTYSMSTR